MDVQQLLSAQIIGPASALAGGVITLIGTLYLAYDLIGERHGFLRLLTEAMTYVIVGIVLGTLALAIIAWDAVAIDPYFTRAVSVGGAVAVLLAFGASAGFGAGLGYVLTIERKWHKGQPRRSERHPAVRIVAGLALGVFYGLLVYAVMDNFRHVDGLLSGLFWGAIQGWPAGLLFGFLVALLLVHFAPRRDDQNGSETSSPSATSIRQPFDTVGLLAGAGVGLGVGPVTAMSYFALYGPFVVQTFVNISLAGIVGGVGVGVVAATAERTLRWIDHLPPKRLGIVGAFLVFLGFLFEASSQGVALWAALERAGVSPH